jgi:hypothetical protein
VPPVAPMAYVVPSEPVNVTCVAFAAVTVRIAEAPAVIDAGFAVIETVAVPEPFEDTVTLAVAVADPPGPVAVTVYVVVAVGATLCVPPVSGSVYELPSDPLIVTFVAFAAVTDKVDDAPAAIDVGLAETLTVGKALVILPLTPPHPATASTAANAQNSNEARRRRSRIDRNTESLPFVTQQRTNRHSDALQAQVIPHVAAGILKEQMNDIG